MTTQGNKFYLNSVKTIYQVNPAVEQITLESINGGKDIQDDIVDRLGNHTDEK